MNDIKLVIVIYISVYSKVSGVSNLKKISQTLIDPGVSPGALSTATMIGRNSWLIGRKN